MYEMHIAHLDTVRHGPCGKPTGFLQTWTSLVIVKQTNVLNHILWNSKQPLWDILARVYLIHCNTAKKRVCDGAQTRQVYL